MTWDMTVVSTLAQSYLHASGHSTAGAAELAVSRNEIKYSCLPECSFCTNLARNSWGNSSLLSRFYHGGGSAVECRYRRCSRDSILVSSHLCRSSTVQCGTHTPVFCHTRRRAGPLAIPTCILASLLALWHFIPLGIKIIN